MNEMCVKGPYVKRKIGLEGKGYGHVQDVLVCSLHHTIFVVEF